MVSIAAMPLAEDVELVVGVLVPGPAEVAGDLGRVERPGRPGRSGRGRAARSWKASSSSTRACEDGATGPCAGRICRSGRPRTLVSDAMKSPSGCGSAGNGEADRRRDRRQHVVAGEQQPVGAVGEDEVARRVARRVRRRRGCARPPAISWSPSSQVSGYSHQAGSGRSVARPPCVPQLGDVGRAGRAEQRRRTGSRRSSSRSLSSVERRLLAAAERHVHAELVAQHRAIVKWSRCTWVTRNRWMSPKPEPIERRHRSSRSRASGIDQPPSISTSPSSVSMT